MIQHKSCKSNSTMPRWWFPTRKLKSKDWRLQSSLWTPKPPSLTITNKMSTHTPIDTLSTRMLEWSSILISRKLERRLKLSKRNICIINQNFTPHNLDSNLISRHKSNIKKAEKSITKMIKKTCKPNITSNRLISKTSWTEEPNSIMMITRPLDNNWLLKERTWD